MPTESAYRITSNTEESINQEILRQIEKNVAYFAGHPEKIQQRLSELDREWDIERMLETGSSALTLGGLILGISRDRRWLLLSLAVQGFMMQHAIQGWCPPLPVLRRIGFRTQYEIEQERYALKVVRGDFKESSEPVKVMEAAGQ